MNWKNEAIEKLRGYQARNKALENIPLEQQGLEVAFSGMGSADTDRVPVIGGSSRHEDAMLDNIVKRGELELAHKLARLWVRAVDNALSVLSDEERRVLRVMDIQREKGGVERLRLEMGLEDARSVYKRRDAALRKFTRSLYGVMET